MLISPHNAELYSGSEPLYSGHTLFTLSQVLAHCGCVNVDLLSV